MPDDLETKRLRERRRRAKFTPEQRAAANAHSALYLRHRRETDVAFLAKSREAVRRLYKKHRDRRMEDMREKWRRSRLTCLQAYSQCAIPFCVCCGEERVDFLNLDHVVDRRSDGGIRVGGNRMGQTLFSWILRMNFPDGFRVLCFNCNCARGMRGYCPHEVELDSAISEMVI